ncbi:MAG TPA: FAD-binding protein [Trebonia sp.]|nr:FAD-binding protein [Trebonia sp.]
MIRALPAVRPRWRLDADVVIAGSGAAGISAALAAAALPGRPRVLMISKDLAGGATPLAQGGLAAAIGPGDSAAAHAEDTLSAGAGLCDPRAVAALAAAAPDAVGWLAATGARLERRALRLEGGHSRRRVAHAGDATGAEVHRALLAALLASRVEVRDRTIALDLAGSGARGGAVAGLLAATVGPGGELDPGLISARAVVLAAGGLGQAFATTTNPAGATGDALAIAARAGAWLRDPEFVQFHPTVLWRDGAAGQRPLITEALRGAGAVLRDLTGRPLMAGHHPRGDLAPRDVVSARMQEAIASGRQNSGHLWLDATALGRGVLENGFPAVTAACRQAGVDPVTEFIPVAPGAHYSCGGIQADLDGRTSIAGLYAVGEAASTGVHGANRLASNSLTEAVICGRRAAGAIGRDLAAGTLPACESADGAIGMLYPGRWRHRQAGGAGGGAIAGGADGGAIAGGAAIAGGGAIAGGAGGGAIAGTPGAGAGVSASERASLAAAMSRYAGVLRDREGLAALVRTLEQAACARAESGGYVRGKDLDMRTVEATNLHTVSALIAVAALRRAESRGCHRRRDAPTAAADPWHTLVRWDGRRLAVTEEPL